MIAIIKKNLSSQKAVEFQTAIANATAMTEKKRTYFSNYGFQNVREVLLGEDKQLVENPQNSSWVSTLASGSDLGVKATMTIVKLIFIPEDEIDSNRAMIRREILEQLDASFDEAKCFTFWLKLY